MPPSSACSIVWPMMTAPPAALRSAYSLLLQTPSEQTDAAAAVVASAHEAATNDIAHSASAAAATSAARASPSPAAAAGSVSSSSSSIAAESSSATATAAHANSNANGKSATSHALSPSLHAWLHECDRRALLRDLVQLLSLPFPVACSSCSARVQSRHRYGPADGNDSFPADDLSLDADEAKSDESRPQFAGIHSRVRLSLESPTFQLNFLRFVPLLLAHEERNSDGAVAPAASSQSSELQVSLVSLLRQFALECDWRVDEKEYLRRCQLVPPAVAGSDPLFPAEGLYVPTPPQLVAARAYYHHSAIFDALRSLVDVLPQLAPLTLPHKQERYFKNQQLAVTTNSNAYADLVSRLKKHSLQATFASDSSDSAIASAAADSSEPLRPFHSAHQSPWMRFQLSAEEIAVQQAETAVQQAETTRKEKRHARRKKRRERRALYEGACKRSRGEEAESGESDDEAAKVEQAPLPQSKAALDADEDFIMLSQAPRHTAAPSTAAAAAPSPFSKRPAHHRRGSMDSSSSSASGASTPSRLEGLDPLDAAAVRLGLLEPPFPELLFDEPGEDEEQQHGGIGTDEPFSFSFTQSQGLSQDQGQNQGISLDEAFASASQQRAADTGEEMVESKGENDVSGSGPMEIEQDEAPAASAAPVSNPSVSPPPPAAALRASPPPAPLPPSEPLLPQLETLRTSLEHSSFAAPSSAQAALLEVVRDVLARDPAGIPAPLDFSKPLLSHPKLSTSASAVGQVFSVAHRWREDVRSPAEFDAACARFCMASLSPGTMLLFLSAFLDGNISLARVRIVLSQSVLPMMQSQCESKKHVSGPVQLLLSLLLRGHEEALVASVLCPFLAHMFAAPQVDVNGPAMSLVQQLIADPAAASGSSAAAAGAPSPAAAVLSATSRLLLLQQLCIVSLQQYERAPAASSSAAFAWNDAALLLLSRLLSSKLTTLPPPHAEHHAVLGALAAGATAGGVGILAKLLPWAATASSSSSDAGALHSLGDVTSLLLACFALAASNHTMRTQPNFTRTLMAYASAYAAPHGLARSQPLQQLMQTISSSVAGPAGKSINRAMAAAAAQAAKT